jgi:hypothetical protein
MDSPCGAASVFSMILSRVIENLGHFGNNLRANAKEGA